MALTLEIPHQTANPWERKGFWITGEGSPLKGHSRGRQGSAAAENA